VKGSYDHNRVENPIELEVNILAGCFGAPFPPRVNGGTSQNVKVANATFVGFEVKIVYNS